VGHLFLADTGNALVALARILGHEKLKTTTRYTKRISEQLGDASDRLTC
jgi:site-specific recombinase XerD